MNAARLAPVHPRHHSTRPFDALTPRQMEVVLLAARGHNNAQIASCLFLAEKTVKNYLMYAFKVLGAESRTQAVIEAIRRGWAPCPCGHSGGIQHRKPRPQRRVSCTA